MSENSKYPRESFWENPKVPFYYSHEHDQGMGVPNRCGGCGGPLSLKPLGWTCEKCGAGYGRDDR